MARSQWILEAGWSDGAVRGAHADELADPLAHELDPLDRLKGSVKKFERPTDPATDPEDWDAWFNEGGVSGDLMEGNREKR